MIVTDARLKEEIEIPKNIFSTVTVIRIERQMSDNGLNEIQKNHITETDLDKYTNYDYRISNNEDIKKLKSKVYDILKEVDSNEQSSCH